MIGVALTRSDNHNDRTLQTPTSIGRTPINHRQMRGRSNQTQLRQDLERPLDILSINAGMHPDNTGADTNDAQEPWSKPRVIATEPYSLTAST